MKFINHGIDYYIDNIKDGSFLHKIKDSFINRVRICKIVDNNILAKQKEDKAYRIIEKKYEGVINDIDFTSEVESKTGSNVWVCWFQGIDEAPTLVHRCIESMREHIRDRNIVIIDKDNYRAPLKTTKRAQNMV